MIHFTSPAGWLPVHRDQLRAQRSVTSMGKLHLFTLDCVILAKNLKVFLGGHFLRYLGSKLKNSKKKKSYRNFPLTICWYSVASVPIYHCAKIHWLLTSNKLSNKMRIFELSRLLAHFWPFNEHPRLHLYSSKTKQVRWAISCIPDNSSLVYKSLKTSIQGSRFGSYSAPKSVSKPKISLFLRSAGVQTVRPRGAVVALFCITDGPLLNALTSF